MTTYFVYGYFGSNNLGDELILYGFLKALFSRSAGVENVIISSKLSGNEFLSYYEKSFPPGRIEFTDRSRNPLSISNLSAVLKAECFIVPGGGIFQDYGIPSFLCYFSQASLAKILGRKVFLLYQGFTGINRRFFKNVMRWGIKNLFDYVSVRDKYSLETYLRNAPAEFPVSASQFSDLVFILSKEFEAACPPDEPNREGSATVGFAFRSWKGFSESDMAACVEKIVDSTGLKAVLYPMQYPDDLELNAEIIKSISARNKINVSAVGFCPDPVSFFKSVGRNRFNIGTRFHFSVLSAMAKVPCIGISYDDKVRELYREAGIPEFCVTLDSPNASGDIADGVAARIKLAGANYGAISKRLAMYSGIKAEAADKLFDEFILGTAEIKK